MKLKVNKEVNPHFEEFLFDWDKKYYFLVGGYGSSKSYHAGLKIILKCLAETRKVLVVRQVYDTLRESTYDMLMDIINDLEVGNYIKATTSPLKIVFHNGSEIIFKGLDKADKLKSIHNISIVWIEECSEITYVGFKELLGRARHPKLPIHFVLTSNPVSKDNWSYKHFFIDETDLLNPIKTLDDNRLYKERIIRTEDTFYHHSTADDNYFLPDSYTETLDELKTYDPDLYRIARLGRYGLVGKKVLPQAKVKEHDWILAKISNIPSRWYRVGMDFGFENSFNAVIRCVIDDKNKDLYIWWEYYKNQMTDVETIEDKEFQTLKEYDELIIADSAEPKTIKFYNQSGYKMRGAKKGPGSRIQNIKKMKRFKNIYISNQCSNAVKEFTTLTYLEDRDGKIIEDEFTIDPHTVEATWYAIDNYTVADLKERNNYSGKGRR